MKEWITEAIQGLDAEIDKLQTTRLNLVELAQDSVSREPRRVVKKSHHKANGAVKGAIACRKQGCKRLFKNKADMAMHFTRAHTAAGKAAFRNAEAKRKATMAGKAT